MLTKENQIKFIDFGTAKDLSNPTKKGSGNTARGKKFYDNFVGTPNFMAPECVHNKNSDKKSDIWSLGGLAFQFITGFPPFIGKSEYLIFKQIVDNEIVFPEGIFDETYKDFIITLMNVNQEERPCIEDVKKHSFFENFDFDNIG